MFLVGVLYFGRIYNVVQRPEEGEADGDEGREPQ